MPQTMVILRTEQEYNTITISSLKMTSGNLYENLYSIISDKLLDLKGQSTFISNFQD